jgi:hypothetical protein
MPSAHAAVIIPAALLAAFGPCGPTAATPAGVASHTGGRTGTARASLRAAASSAAAADALR